MSMKFSVSLVAGVAALLGLGSITSDALADSLGVSASVPDACTVTAGTLPFGTYDPATQTGDLVGTGTFDVVCTLGSDVNVLMDAGANLDSGIRRMAGSNGDFLTYSLFQDSGFGSEWGNDTGNFPQPSKNFPALAASTNNISVTGLVQGGQNVVGGNYSDTVNISLVFN